MKIVGTDNHASETVSDHLLCDGLPNDTALLPGYLAVCNALNRRLGDGPGKFYQVKPDEYEVYRYEP